ncbi:MAG: hypothetical protein NVSMB6_01010 [Burkholderiaceae bacterium]
MSANFIFSGKAGSDLTHGMKILMLNYCRKWNLGSEITPNKMKMAEAATCPGFSTS